MKQRFDYLDSIRGIAAFVVVLSHIADAAHFSTDLINIGRYGVFVFFIVSGFVIPWSLDESDKSAIKKFLIKRFFRLFPVYWFSIIFACLAVFLCKDAIFNGTGVKVETFLQVLANFTMVHQVLGFDSVIGVYWTLFIELIFYGICVVLFYLGILNNIKVQIIICLFLLLVACAVSALKFYSGISLPMIIPMSLSIMFYGSLLRMYLVDGKVNLKSILIYLAVTYFIGVFIACLLYFQDGWGKWFLTYILAFSSCLLMMTFFKVKSAMFVYLGKISYSVYLLHPILLGFCFYIFNGNLFLSVLSTLLSTIIISSISYHFIEYKIGSLNKKFLKNTTI